jgi:hypothetical protein
MKRGSKGILPVGGDPRRIPFHKESMGETPMLRHSESFSNTLLDWITNKDADREGP